MRQQKTVKHFGACDRYYKRALTLDIYRTPFKFLFFDGNENYRTFLGTILSLLTVITILSYGLVKVIQVFSAEEFEVMQRH